MREQKWGRFINMTSTSGLVGNVGQANYAAAKLGIVGLTKVTALDMARYNVTANCISPFAWTRMIGTIPTETEAQKARVEKIKKMSPAHIAPRGGLPRVSDAAKDVTGQVFGVRGKEIMLFSHMRPVARASTTSGWTPERLAEMFPGTLQPSPGAARDLGAVLQLRPARCDSACRARDEQQAAENGDTEPDPLRGPGTHATARRPSSGPAGSFTSSIPRSSRRAASR